MNDFPAKPIADSLTNIQKLVSDLNKSLLELKEDKDEYESHINECKGLCNRIRELMDATTARIITTGEPELSYQADC
jgi:peptidoglycan hydrolase CwlO-like protein